jgi:hypothetical protein
MILLSDKWAERLLRGLKATDQTNHGREHPHRDVHRRTSSRNACSGFFKRLEHIMPPFNLRVLRVLDLDPAMHRVHAHPALRHHAFEVPLDNFLEQ